MSRPTVWTHAAIADINIAAHPLLYRIKFQRHVAGKDLDPLLGDNAGILHTNVKTFLTHI